MAVDVKNLVAAINPKIYCDDTPDLSGKRLSDNVTEIAKKSGYLKAAEKAKLKESDYLDVLQAQFARGAFELTGIKNPVEQHKIVYDASSQSLEPLYFWIHDYVNGVYGKTDKLIDNFVSSPGSGFFSELQTKATRMQEEAMKIFGTINNVIRSVLNLIYDLKEFKLRLGQYDDFHSSDMKTKRAALLSLKQIWMDNVDIKRQNSSIKALAQQFDYVTIIDAFMAAESSKKLKELDLNDRVKRILEQRLSEFERWVIESEKELRKRFEIEKSYLLSQINSVKLYARWVKPYLKAARQLEQNSSANADIVTAFNTAVFELVLLAEGKYEPREDILKGDLPKAFLKIRARKYSPMILVEFRYRSIPDRSDQRGGYSFRGKVEVVFTSFAFNEDEIKILKEKVAEDDFGEVYKWIEGATDKSFEELQQDLEDLLGDKWATKKEDKNKKDEDTNPFSALFSVFKKEEKKEETDLSKGIPKDTDYEKVIRSQAILKARIECRKLYDTFKKVQGMPAFPQTM